MGNNGFFRIPFGRETLACQISEGGGWDHVSVSLPHRCPTWEEMCFIKELFFRDDETCFQLHPAKKENISFHPYCLHIWRPQTQEECDVVKQAWGDEWPYGSAFVAPSAIPLPPVIFVGPQTTEKGGVLCE
jgi:hypothetical protein